MTDSTEYVEITHKVKYTFRLPRKKNYRGMTEEEIIAHESDKANAVESIMFAFQSGELDDMITTKVKIYSDLDEQREEEE